MGKKRYEKIKSLNTVLEASFSTDNNEITLKAPPLPDNKFPTVSVLTITKNRADIFDLAIFNWKNFKYPENKIEWVIIDDSDNEKLGNLLPDDERIKYFYTPTSPCALTFSDIAEKRNFGIDKCQNSVISIMDDDDYHYPDSILGKIRIMDKYKKDCVITNKIAVYNLILNKSQIMEAKSIKDSRKMVPEAFLTFKKSFWASQKFAINDENNGEGYAMIEGRFKKLIRIPYFFNGIAITHKENVTGNSRNVGDGLGNFYDLLDEEVKKILDDWREKS